MSDIYKRWQAAVTELDRLTNQAEWEPTLSHRINGQKNLVATLEAQYEAEQATQVVEQDPDADPRNEALEADERMREARA